MSNISDFLQSSQTISSGGMNLISVRTDNKTAQIPFKLFGGRSKYFYVVTDDDATYSVSENGVDWSTFAVTAGAYFLKLTDGAYFNSVKKPAIREYLNSVTMSPVTTDRELVAARIDRNGDKIFTSDESVRMPLNGKGSSDVTEYNGNESGVYWPERDIYVTHSWLGGAVNLPEGSVNFSIILGRNVDISSIAFAGSDLLVFDTISLNVIKYNTNTGVVEEEIPLTVLNNPTENYERWVSICVLPSGDLVSAQPSRFYQGGAIKFYEGISNTVTHSLATQGGFTSVIKLRTFLAYSYPDDKLLLTINWNRDSSPDTFNIYNIIYSTFNTQEVTSPMLITSEGDVV